MTFLLCQKTLLRFLSIFLAIVALVPFTASCTDSNAVDATMQSETNVFSEYILNRSTKKIHLSSCKSVTLIHESNRIEYTGELSELLLRGYTTCGNCFAE